MDEQDLRKLAAESFAGYLKDHPMVDGGECYVDGYLAGARLMAKYINDAIMFMAENNPKL